MARKRKEVELEAPAADDAADVAVAPEAQSIEQEDVALDSVEAAPVADPVKWVVLEEARVSLYGQITTLPEGSFVSVASYGEDGIRRIMQQGVMLAPVA